MRGPAVLLIGMLLASVQCITACTLASCGETQQKQVPPCHQHQSPTPEQESTHTKACDHQKATDQVRDLMPDLQLVVLVIDAPAVAPMSQAAWEPGAQLFASPPPLTVSSPILRI